MTARRACAIDSVIQNTRTARKVIYTSICTSSGQSNPRLNLCADLMVLMEREGAGGLSYSKPNQVQASTLRAHFLTSDIRLYLVNVGGRMDLSETAMVFISFSAFTRNTDDVARV